MSGEDKIVYLVSCWDHCFAVQKQQQKKSRLSYLFHFRTGNTYETPPKDQAVVQVKLEVLR